MHCLQICRPLPCPSRGGWLSLRFVTVPHVLINTVISRQVCCIFTVTLVKRLNCIHLFSVRLGAVLASWHSCGYRSTNCRSHTPVSRLAGKSLSPWLSPEPSLHLTFIVLPDNMYASWGLSAWFVTTIPSTQDTLVIIEQTAVCVKGCAVIHLQFSISIFLLKTLLSVRMRKLCCL